MDEESKIKVEDMHMGRLIGILSHQMVRNRNNPSVVMESDELTAMQKHVLKFILLETLHRGYRRGISDTEINCYGDPSADGEERFYLQGMCEAGWTSEADRTY